MNLEQLLTILLINLAKNGTNNNTTDTYKGLIRNIYKPGKQQGCKKDCGEPLFLTPLIDDNKLEEARNASSVDPKFFLPGIKSYSGYVTVEDEYNSNMFFWYFPVKGKPVKDTPLVVWTQGGPGAPSTYGLFNEIGPFTLNDNNEVEEMEFSWGKNNSILFIDCPVGAGYSFTDSDDGYATEQTLIGEHLYSALQQIFDIFPELRKAPTYLVGSLYAAKHAISLGSQIHRNKCEEDPINLQGFIIPNGLMKAEIQLNHSSFGYETLLIIKKASEGVKKYQELGAKAIRNGNTTKAFYYYNKAATIFNNSAGLPNPANFAGGAYPSFDNVMDFLQQPKIRKALHVGNTPFGNLGKAYEKLIPDIMNDVQSWLQELMNYYKFLFINGMLGTLIPTVPSKRFYNTLEFDNAQEFKQPLIKFYIYDGVVSGYYVDAGNVSSIILLRSGNFAIVDNPEQLLDIVTDFFNDRLFQNWSQKL